MIKTWHIDKDWQETFVDALRARGASGPATSRALTVVDDALTVSGSTAQEEFGEPAAYAETIVLTDDPDAVRASQTKAVLLALLGLVGMFVALWGTTGLARDFDRLGGVAPLILLILGLVIAVGAAVADAVLGRKADIVHGPVGSGEARGGSALLLNRFGPWLIVLLTLVGILLLWIRYN